MSKLSGISIAVLFPLLGVASCGADDRLDGEGIGSTTLESSGDDATGDTDSGVGDDTGQDKFDVPGFDPDGQDDEGCQKVDLLFVVDDSGSMANNQKQLIDSFPGFIEGIQDELGDVDGYHVGVVTTDAYKYNAAGCTAIGDLVTQTGGGDSSDSVCGPYASQAGHMNESDELETTFACAAHVGVSGDPGERPIDGIRGALDPARQLPGGCNEGFLRDDALLVIVVITDEDDVLIPFDHNSGSPGDPAEWFTEIVDRKAGVESNVVMLSIVGPLDGAGCDGLEDKGFRLRKLTEMFTHGYIGSVCAPTYAPFLAQAVGMIESACSDFTPPG